MEDKLTFSKIFLLCVGLIIIGAFAYLDREGLSDELDSVRLSVPGGKLSLPVIKSTQASLSGALPDELKGLEVNGFTRVGAQKVLYRDGREGYVFFSEVPKSMNLFGAYNDYFLTLRPQNWKVLFGSRDGSQDARSWIIEVEKGDWQARITGSRDDKEVIRVFVQAIRK